MQITGWGQGGASPHFETTSGQVFVAEVAAILGLTVEQTRELIIEWLLREDPALGVLRAPFPRLSPRISGSVGGPPTSADGEAARPGDGG